MKTASKASAATNEFHDFLADMETLLRQTATLTGDELAQARDKIQQRISAAKKSAAKMGQSLADDACDITSKVNEEVHAEPWKAIGAVAVVGVLLGLLFARK